jgi:hypothetical protein
MHGNRHKDFCAHLDEDGAEGEHAAYSDRESRAHVPDL